MRIAFEGLSAVVEAPDCPVFVETLRGAAPDWPFARTEREEEPLARVEATETGYTLFSPWREGTELTGLSAVRAVCGLLADIVTSHIDENPSRLCLHCGAALISGRLVMFPSRSHAGKSTLIARLAASGCRIFGDDVLPLTSADDHGVALGLAPRLRLPLPARASAEFRRFVSENAGPSDDRYQYLALAKNHLAPRGVVAPLGAIILLDRQPAAAAAIGPAGRAETLKALISQNFARGEPAGELLQRLHRLMNAVPRFTLRYSDLDEAAALLLHSFAAWPPDLDADGRPAPPLRANCNGAPQAAIPENDEQATPLLTAGMLWRQNPASRLHVVDGEAFLTDANDEAIHHLDPIGAGLWRLLADGITLEEAVDVLHGAFPAIARDAIVSDVSTVFAQLASSGLILPQADDLKGQD
ncbi:MAG: PqqD family protein [Rhodomicrobiaceae bacterium]